MTTKSFGRIATATITAALSIGTVTGVGHVVDQRVQAQQDEVRSLLAVGGAPVNQQQSVVQVGTTTTTMTSQQSRLGFTTDTMHDYLTASAADVDATWVRLFAGWGYTTTPAAYVVFPGPGESVQACGKASTDGTMEYCSGTDTITFSQQAATELWEGEFHGVNHGDSGGMAVSLLVAHEYGHNIEAELGLMGGTSLHDAAARERGADCFAGVWADDAADRGLLSDADVSAAYAALDQVAEHPELGASDNGVHGTTQDRQEAYEIGAEQGAKACVDAYLSSLGQ